MFFDRHQCFNCYNYNFLCESPFWGSFRAQDTNKKLLSKILHFNKMPIRLSLFKMIFIAKIVPQCYLKGEKSALLDFAVYCVWRVNCQNWGLN